MRYGQEYKRASLSEIFKDSFFFPNNCTFMTSDSIFSCKCGRFETNFVLSKSTASTSSSDSFLAPDDTDSSGVYICKSIVNYLRHGNYICKS